MSDRDEFEKWLPFGAGSAYADAKDAGKDNMTISCELVVELVDEIDRLKAQLKEYEEKGRVLMDISRDLKARVTELEGSIKHAIGWIDGDLRELIRDMGNTVCTYNDLYGAADRIEAILVQSLRQQADALECQSEGGE